MHVEVTLDRGVAGPLALGDGRFLGLGVMRPVKQPVGLFVFAIEAGLLSSEPLEITRALRRAVMARVQEVIGPRKELPRFFSGHEADASLARNGSHDHLAFAFDPCQSRLLIIAPHLLTRQPIERREADYLRVLDDALGGFTDLRAGSAGRLVLRPVVSDADRDPLFAPSTSWRSVTQYQATRHAKRVTAAEALTTDIRAECRRSGLPEPLIDVLETTGISGAGLTGTAQLVFEVAVAGPLVLGRSRHFGGGLFTAVPIDRRASGAHARGSS